MSLLCCIKNKDTLQESDLFMNMHESSFNMGLIFKTFKISLGTCLSGIEILNIFLLHLSQIACNSIHELGQPSMLYFYFRIYYTHSYAMLQISE